MDGRFRSSYGWKVAGIQLEAQPSAVIFKGKTRSHPVKSSALTLVKLILQDRWKLPL